MELNIGTGLFGRLNLVGIKTIKWTLMLVFEDYSAPPSLSIIIEEGRKMKDMFLSWASGHMFEPLAGKLAFDDVKLTNTLSCLALDRAARRLRWKCTGGETEGSVHVPEPESSKHLCFSLKNESCRKFSLFVLLGEAASLVISKNPSRRSGINF